VQDPVRLDLRSEPQPDVALLRWQADFYAAEPPGPADVLLVVEVGDSSAASDRLVKLPLYAAAGVPEVWLVDLEHGVVEVYRQPSASGYGHVQECGPGAQVTVELLPAVSLGVGAVLGRSGSVALGGR